MYREIAREAGFDETRYNTFLEGLKANPDLKEELDYFLEKNSFLGKAKAAGFSLSDILIYQIDHFRARLDRDTTLTRNNPKTMILLAVETMVNLRNDPEKFTREFSTETGTDFVI